MAVWTFDANHFTFDDDSNHTFDGAHVHTVVESSVCFLSSITNLLLIDSLISNVLIDSLITSEVSFNSNIEKCN